MGTGELYAGGLGGEPNDGLASHPGGRARNVPSGFMSQKLEISSSLMNHLVHIRA